MKNEFENKKTSELMDLLETGFDDDMNKFDACMNELKKRLAYV